jgi:hypothetical protein
MHRPATASEASTLPNMPAAHRSTPGNSSAVASDRPAFLQVPPIKVASESLALMHKARRRVPSMGSWSSTMGSLACVLPCTKPQHSIHCRKLASSPRLVSAWPGLSLNTLFCPILRLQSERRLANFDVGVVFQERGTAGSRCERVISSRCRARPTGIRYTLA